MYTKDQVKNIINFELFFDNGGGVTLQTEEYAHYYQDGKQVAEDVKFLLDGEDIEEWDGNEKEEIGEREVDETDNYLDKDLLIEVLNGENEEVKDQIISGYTGRKFMETFYAQELLSKNDYTGSEILMNITTGSTQAAQNWAQELAAGIWCEEHEEEHFCAEIEDQFSLLVHVSKDHDGNYKEVK